MLFSSSGSLIVIASTAFLLHQVECLFNATSNTNIIYYWFVPLFLHKKQQKELISIFC